MCRDAGDLFWMTTTELRSLVMILLKPEKSWTIVPKLMNRYGMEFGGLIIFAFFWLRRRRMVERIGLLELD